MTNDYKIEQRKKKRGSHCVFAYIDKNGVERSCKCGCGCRDEIGKKHKTRIIKRSLNRQLRNIIDEL